ncbi:PucR family transcriptional regulator [Subtercola lobariae]|uniref:PucR family transcriptional regulator n=2 Tax=Subtercola lobariae TaxID=1588641 RepID=A0A917B581_9MICO|nr:PucR family transcriptional regulator [Subtercola lobariae]
MPELTTLDEPSLAALMAAVGRLRESVDSWSERFLALARQFIPGYELLTDDEIRASARSFLEGEINELASFRIPDAALREQLQVLALRRVAQGVSIDTLSLSYRLGSREMLALVDEIAVEVNMPKDLLLAIHDSSWEFANEASTVFARVQREITVERARFDAERRAAFGRGILSGTLPVDDIIRDAGLFGLDARRDYVVLVARATSTASTEAVRRAMTAATRTAPDRLLFVKIGDQLGCIAPTAPVAAGVAVLAVGTAGPLESLHTAFEEAVLALETAERFELHGTVRLDDLGARPLVLAESRAAGLLETRHFGVLDADERGGPEHGGSELEETTRVYLECDQQAHEAARRLTVHPNTVRYRVNRFREVTGLDVRRTEDLVAAWWLLNRRRGLRRGGAGAESRVDDGLVVHSPDTGGAGAADRGDTGTSSEPVVHGAGLEYVS